MRRTLCTLALAAAAAAGAAAGWSPPVAAAGQPVRYPIHPGASLSISGNHCEVGFLLRQGRHVYVALPASCLGTDGGDGSDGCMEAQIPYSSRAHIHGARRPALLVYSSFSEMQLRGTHRPHECYNNNLGLLRLSRQDALHATPMVPGAGIPRRTADAPASGAVLRTYINGGATTATAGSTTAGGWRHAATIDGSVTAANLGAPIVAAGRRAVGMETVLPTLTSMNASQVTDLRRELRFLRTIHGFHHVHLLRSPLR